MSRKNYFVFTDKKVDDFLSSRQVARTCTERPYYSEVYNSSTHTIREFNNSPEVLKVVEEYKLGHYDTLDFVRKISTIKGYNEAMAARDALSKL